MVPGMVHNMKITDLSGYTVKLAARSITAVNADGKTAGLVRGFTNYKNTAPRDQFSVSKQLRGSGLWNAANSSFLDYTRYFYTDGKTAYYLHDEKATENLLKYAPDIFNNTAGLVIIPVKWDQFYYH